MTVSPIPIIYSFRRCPYAMRARLAIYLVGIQVELREILLKKKPAQMLKASPKGTVPVLVLPNEQVIDESIDIVCWALDQSSDPYWLQQLALYQDKSICSDTTFELIQDNDQQFKYWLDRYKYSVGYPEHSVDFYFDKAVAILQRWETHLTDNMSANDFVGFYGSCISLVDIALFPFVRQFAMVDTSEFDRLPLPNLQLWLQRWLAAPEFLAVMHKYPPWEPSHPQLLLKTQK